MDNSPFLSICIPTYNRAEALSKCLDELLAQISAAGVQEKVEIVISDNGSIDNTKDVVRSYQEKFSNIIFSGFEKNLEFDPNLDNTLTMASGTYCWMLNDNALIVDDAVKYLVETLESNNGLKVLLIKDGPNNGFETVSDGSQLLEKFGLIGGKLARCIVKRESLPADRKKYYGNSWMHYSMILEVIAHDPVGLTKNLFIDPSKSIETRWVKDGNLIIVYTKLKKIIKNLANYGYDKKIIAKVDRGFVRGLPKQISSAKLYGLKPSLKNAKLIIKEYKSPAIVALCLFLMILPRFVFVLLRKIYRKIWKKN